MEKSINVNQAIEEIKGANEEQLKQVISDWFERTRTQSMKIGASYVSAAVYEAIEKNLRSGFSSSLRDYQRAIKRIIEIVSVQLKQQETQQNDSEDSITESVTIEEGTV